MGEYLRPGDEAAAAYPALRERLVALVRGRDEADGGLPVPHCPYWTVRDLLAHMIGVPEDVLAGDVEGAGSDRWTRAQVEGPLDDATGRPDPGPVQLLLRGFPFALPVTAVPE